MEKEEEEDKVKLLFVLDAPPDVDGGSIGLRDTVAAVLEPIGRVRFVGEVPSERVTRREGDVIRYIGESDYIPCARKGACLDGAACAGCAHADALALLCKFEEIVAALEAVTTDARRKR